ncbi:hypothetical protein DFH07DRAFT_766494 [Mycena maculata]|uniref:Uncharacterized protein n=1 Tax=Mycena maculata TaxID=230809 RepID=A0AAD7K6M9_9AGAR|nr:hypothetical protein DFH07DRAFT_766494 [Mycena maculata]
MRGTRGLLCRTGFGRSSPAWEARDAMICVDGWAWCGVGYETAKGNCGSWRACGWATRGRGQQHLCHRKKNPTLTAAKRAVHGGAEDHPKDDSWRHHDVPHPHEFHRTGARGRGRFGEGTGRMLVEGAIDGLAGRGLELGSKKVDGGSEGGRRRECGVQSTRWGVGGAVGGSGLLLHKGRARLVDVNGNDRRRSDGDDRRGGEYSGGRRYHRYNCGEKEREAMRGDRPGSRLSGSSSVVPYKRLQSGKRRHQLALFFSWTRKRNTLSIIEQSKPFAEETFVRSNAGNGVKQVLRENVSTCTLRMNSCGIEPATVAADDHDEACARRGAIGARGKARAGQDGAGEWEAETKSGERPLCGRVSQIG